MLSRSRAIVSTIAVTLTFGAALCGCDNNPGGSSSNASVPPPTASMLSQYGPTNNETNASSFWMYQPLPPVRAIAARGLAASDLEPLPMELPMAATVCTPKPLPRFTTINRNVAFRRRGSFIVPNGLVVLSRNKQVTLSDVDPIVGDAPLITDGYKQGSDGDWLEMGPGRQWAQVDLAAPAEIWAIVIWHYHAEPRVYRDVIVQVSNDPEFSKDVFTLFNNDQDNSSGLGAGKDNEYLEFTEGKLVDGLATKARYIRCYSNGNTSDAQNHLIEIEVWGKPVK